MYRNIRFKNFLAASVVGAGTIGIGVFGQAAGAIAQTTNVPQLPTREEVTPPDVKPVTQPQVSVARDDAIEVSSCPFENSELTLDLKSVDFFGMVGGQLPPEILKTLNSVEVPSGQQPIRIICRIRDEASAALRQDGWIATLQIPPQTIEDGVIRMGVVTARITEVRVRGEVGRNREVLSKAIEQMKAIDPLNQKDIERILLVVGDVPGLNIRMALRPEGKVVGNVIGELEFNYDNFGIVANVQNLQSRAIGRYITYLRTEFYGLTGMADLSYLGISVSPEFKEQVFGQVGHEFQVGNSGTRIGGNFVYVKSRPDLGNLKLITDTYIGSITAKHPLRRSTGSNLSVYGGLEWVDQDTTVGGIFGNAPLSSDSLRIASLGLQGNIGEQYVSGRNKWLLTANLEGRQGFSLLGASEKAVNSNPPFPSRFDGDSGATVVRLDATATYQLNRIFGVYGEVRGQWSSAPLLNYEEFSVGNLSIGRGYDPGVTSGDKAAAFRGEVRVDLPVARSFTSEAFGFYDHVFIDNLDLNATERNRTLRSTGGGMRLGIPGKVTFEATYAHPMDRALSLDTQKPTDRFLLTVSAKISGR
jgi:hemolysin activation/secretion protein